MMKTSLREAKINDLRAELKAEEEALNVQKKRDEKALVAATKYAGGNRVRSMESIYELLGIEPEFATTRLVKGRVGTVQVDKDEARRTARAFAVIEALFHAADAELIEQLALDDLEGRESRRPKNARGTASVAAEDSPVESDQATSSRWSSSDDVDGVANAADAVSDNFVSHGGMHG